MSIDDKYYDVEAALKGKPEAKDFAELMDYFGTLEVVQASIARENTILRNAVKVLNYEGLKESIETLYEKRKALEQAEGRTGRPRTNAIVDALKRLVDDVQTLAQMEIIDLPDSYGPACDALDNYLKTMLAAREGE